MSAFRYEYVTPETVGNLNHLLRLGWQPVREITAGSAGSDRMLVVLSKESEFPVFDGEEIVPGVSLGFLSDVMLFEGFEPAELRQLIPQCEITTVDEDARLFERGDPSDAIFVVLSGEVQVTLPDLPDLRQAVVTLVRGGVFGESSYFSESPHTMAATAGSAGATLLSLTRPALESMLQAQLPVAAKLTHNAASILAARLQETDEWVRELLSDRQRDQINASWRRFRHHVRSSDTFGGFFGV